MLEKRTFPRLDCPNDKACTVIGNKETDLSGELRNMSRSGAKLISKNRLKADSKVDILINYPELEREIPSAARVIWSRQEKDLFSYGIRFVNISNEDKYDLLDHFYESWKEEFLSKRR